MRYVYVEYYSDSSKCWVMDCRFRIGADNMIPVEVVEVFNELTVMRGLKARFTIDN